MTSKPSPPSKMVQCAQNYSLWLERRRAAMSGNPICNKYKQCCVPMCKSTTIATPQKWFLCAPVDSKTRKKWYAAMGWLKQEHSKKTRVFCCEDHFNLEEDLENYWRVKLMGGNKILKKGVVPHIFHCQMVKGRRKITDSLETSDAKDEKEAIKVEEDADIMIEHVKIEFEDDTTETKPDPREDESEEVANNRIWRVIQAQKQTFAAERQAARQEIKRMQLEWKHEIVISERQKAFAQKKLAHMAEIHQLKMEQLRLEKEFIMKLARIDGATTDDTDPNDGIDISDSIDRL